MTAAEMVGSLPHTAMSVVGSHTLLELYECSATRLDDLAHVQAALREAARVAGATLVAECAHQFSPQGVTALGLLAESHLSIHTWPERHYAAADLFTCGPSMATAEACAFLVQAFSARRHVIRVVSRGDELAEDAAADAPSNRAMAPLRESPSSRRDPGSR